MQLDTLVQYLKSEEQSESYLRELGLRDTARAHRNLARIAEAGVTLDLVVFLCEQLEEQLRAKGDEIEKMRRRGAAESEDEDAAAVAAEQHEGRTRPTSS